MFPLNVGIKLVGFHNLFYNFEVHKDNVNLIEYDEDLINVLFLHANKTQLLQPLDISVNNLVKKTSKSDVGLEFLKGLFHE